MINELYSINLKQLLKIECNDPLVKAIKFYLKKTSEFNIGALLYSLKDSELKYIQPSLIGFLNNYSLLELAIQTGYISNEIPFSLKRKIKSNLSMFGINREEYIYRLPLIKKLMTRVDDDKKNEINKQIEYRTSFFEFLALYDDINCDLTFNNLIKCG